MTAEIAIMNKLAVALAADSAVTIGHSQGQKIYNTVNKLFMLSKYCPVGIMVYGNAELMGVPWEIIIKLYRQELGQEKFNTLDEYVKGFVTFIESRPGLFPIEEQERHVRSSVHGYFAMIADNINKKVKSILERQQALDQTELSALVRDVIREHSEKIATFPQFLHVNKKYLNDISTKYRPMISEMRKKAFAELPVSLFAKQLSNIAIGLLTREIFSNRVSGVVIAGFGEAEIYPSLVSIKTEAVVNDKLLYNGRSQIIGNNSRACISPFAQREMVDMFMGGIDPNYGKQIEQYLSEIFDKYPDSIVETIDHLSEQAKESLVTNLKQLGREFVNDFNQRTEEYRRTYHINPIIDIVAVLPKDELAAMAESFVNLTSLKRRISLDAETVGGPIDVAVISKGDGFIWIRRKHYFKPELNHTLFANYFQHYYSPKGDDND